MAVEKMTMMNIIGNISDVDNVLKDIILSSKVNLVSALSQIEDNSFVFNVKDENLEKVIDLNYITSFSRDKGYEELLKKGEELEEVLNIKSNYLNLNLKDNMDIGEISQIIDNIYKEVKEPSEILKSTKEELEKIENFYKNFSEIRDINTPIESLRELSYFDFRFGILSKEDRIKLKKNYDNILAVILHTGTGNEGEVYLVLYPSNIREEMNRILKSLNFKEIQVQDEYKGTPIEMIEYLRDKKERLKKDIDSLEKTLWNLREVHKDTIISLVNQLRTKEKIEDIKEELARSNKFFYLSGWVSKKDKEIIGEMLKEYKDILVIFKDETDLTPPTKLRNIWIFKPFESLVKMYGMPSYNELDPTPFLSLSYMFLFGAMFGDLGQGVILLLGGMLLSRKNKMFGGLLSRLGASSMIFGILYGAVFGIETIIPALLIKPFENINTILVSAIFVGIALILISYIYGMINSIKRKDMEDGLFGKEGLAGFLFYLCLLILIGGNLLKKPILSMELGAVIIILCMAVMIFKQPLTHLIKGKRPLHGEDITGYYIESVFSIIETLLSMLSGTVSFIRVGAFALTHVGLFIAFETIGHMIGTPAGNIIVLIIGNIVIIGMEGLIVFIQGLRLQYYELFSRYYKGEGKEFKPVNIK
ncbi:V/A-type H+-transporting ATPase subunit I [Tissierella praeacuta DSM 18095]|uniref:V/A-type H+-transporting ATPase subunit I n=1 Tax=Tissierella praeacuta DSM 18095 TaxID=1123404 RepID=A0A1M4VRK1_9FIRM|nr:V-type ATPase 116kDa subunit family protein [Tissierella praeacuta]SHE71694.1 V/A-type H+-transporting ATPase subunit I [Tissierella praeacuta DSM 18095]SUO98930.1 V-type ATP synthase subunit I [Tissierella praeacuta]